MHAYRPGSHDWSWADEAADIASRPRFGEIVAELHLQGWMVPIVVDGGRVVDGHHRLLAALLLGWPVVGADELTAEEEK
jgi:ParB-like chromosome segregation protein Spo0J